MANLCGKCNDPAIMKMTDGKATVKVCAYHWHVLSGQGWKQTYRK